MDSSGEEEGSAAPGGTLRPSKDHYRLHSATVPGTF